MKLAIHGSPRGGTAFEAVMFNIQADALPSGEHWRVAYRLDVNEFRGNRRLQLMVEQAEPVRMG